MRHNKLRDITAQCLTEVCYGVGIKPHLQPLSDEPLHHSTANRDDGTCLDIVTDRFWGSRIQRAFFDVRVFNPFVQYHSKSTLAQCYRKNEQEKKRAYEERVREFEHGSFSALMGPITTVVY